MGCLNSYQTQVPNPDQEEAEDGVETLSLCDLPLYGGEDDAVVKCDGGRSSTSSEEEHDQELFEFSSRELGSAPIPESEKIVFCGRIIHFQERPPPMLCVVKSPGKDCLKKKKNGNTTMMTRRMNGRRLFCWKLRLFRKPRTSYHKMKAEDEDNSNVLGWKQQPQRRRRTYSWGWSGKWYFLMFGSSRFPVEMGLRDIKSRQSRRATPPNLFGLWDYAEAKVGGDNETARSRRNSWGLLNILRCSNRGNGHDHSHSHRNDVLKVSNGCFPK